MEYRMYGLGGKDRIVSGRTCLAPDDLAALQEAEAVCAKNAVEVWQGVRRVARVKKGNTPLAPWDRICL